jgi:ABC-type transporter Mla maintaining outer membrane lipid asymmetry ATPase subunit MlaF
MNLTSATSIHSEHFQGALIEWHDVNFSVPDRSTGQQKRILTDMHGLAQPGRLLVIMGPSGAGKSTLVRIAFVGPGRPRLQPRDRGMA